jgi:flagellar biosynthesis activator protein FlaF
MTSATHGQQHDAYKTHQRQNLTEREIEARALLSCASQLDTASKADNDRKFYDDAIKRNQRLWTIFQVALCDPGNPLPRELKTILLNLSCYVDKISFRALAEYKPGLLDQLIDVNRHIAAGLSSKKAEDKSQPMAPPPEPPGAPVMTTA